MGLASAAIVLAPRADAADGLTDVRLRFSKDRVRRYCNLAVAIEPARHWNPGHDIGKGNYLRGGQAGHRQAVQLNAYLVAELDKGRELIRHHPAASADELKALYRPTTAPAPAVSPADAAPDFLTYFEREVVRLESFGNPRTAKKRRSILKRLRERHPGGLLFAAMTPSWVRDWQAAYLAAHPGGGQTIIKELEVIRSAVKQAAAEKIVPFEANPFHYVKLSRPKAKPRKARMTAAEFARFESMEVPAKRFNTRRHLALLARDAFVIQYYCAGARVGDIIELRERHVLPDRLLFTERKTGKTKSVPRHPRLDAIIAKYLTGEPDRYLLGLLDHSAAYAQPPAADLATARQQLKRLLAVIECQESQINNTLKKLATLAGIEAHITTHVARHTFATVARLRGTPVGTIQEMLNHADISTTQEYIAELEETMLDAATLNVYYDPEESGSTPVSQTANTSTANRSKAPVGAS